MKKMHGKTIHIYLPDGSPSGIRIADMTNWTGRAIAVPRQRVPSLKDSDLLRRPGVYFLFGLDQGEVRHLAYIGEAEDVQTRLQDHSSKKDFWSEAIAFSSKDEFLNKAHIKYLEARLTVCAKEAGRYDILNAVEPKPPTLSAGERDALEEYMEHLQTLLGALGHKLLDPLVPIEVPAGPATPSSGLALFFETVGLAARAIQTDDGFVVLKGSQSRIRETQGVPESCIKLRHKLVAEGILKQSDDFYVFTRDFLFSSPSAAADVVAGGSKNGLKCWKTANGKSLKQLAEEV